MDHIAEALKFMHPDLGKPDAGVVELCATGCYGSQAQLWEGYSGGKNGLASGWYNNRLLLVNMVKDIDAGWRNRGDPAYAESIYITMNPVNEALMGRSNNRLKGSVSRTADKDISTYHNIFIDIDPGIPTGISANDKEHINALALAIKIREWTRNTLFWSDPLYANSGNGAHLIYKSFMQNTPENISLLKNFMLLAKKYFSPNEATGSTATVDATVFNPARLIKLYGTVVRKGDATDTRPHRRSHVIDVPVLVPGIKRGVITAELVNQAITVLQAELGIDPLALPGHTTPGKGTAGGGTSAQARSQYSAYTSPDKMFKSMSGVEPLRQGGTLKVAEYLKDNNIKIKEVKPHGDSTMYILEQCIFDSSHSGGEAAIGQSEDGKLWYHCYHDSCKSDPERKWKAARNLISGRKTLASYVEGGSSGVEFPHVNKDGKPYARFENFTTLVNAYAAKSRRNIMTRKAEHELPQNLGWAGSDKMSNLARAFFAEICTRHGLPSARLDDWILMFAEENTYHPVRRWLESKPWDGKSRLEELSLTVEVPLSHKVQWRLYLKRWLVQGAAALYSPGFSGRGVLVFQGVQNVGKTGWFRRLLPPELGAFGEGVHLDPANKDSMIEVLSKFIVELGELNATFKKADIAKLNAFITKKEDDVRPPYAHNVETWKRQTIFGGTVNDPEFLVDTTGNTRWWVVETLGIDWKHNVDMQQVWAEAKSLLDAGETWFLDATETDAQRLINADHVVVDPIEESIQKHFHFDKPQQFWVNQMTLTEILEYAGVKHIGKSQATTAGILLKHLVGKAVQTRHRGIKGRFYSMPEKRDMFEDISKPGPALKLL